ncbi:hypothetical protein ABRY74_17440 [Pseudomonas guariconensis]|uniref:Uncharacterized protein n=2 Tax=Pseudomonas TaxID=286 RepID=A0AAX0VU36_9PSED|nr:MULTISPECIES: hypothetical protein [Pseudomonas]MBH3360356.1 hypothetical protein [Pseudomonas guariconensis]MCO7620224.1 hypothetical protein [Pseudomonas guariconensis]MDM9592867.1 hypothetical protein [Pseudomonas guariconensis]MDM9605694.1 hypothetical protein [Pseudomonas guariconensis]MDM9610651.1 hypothetical protein [Pseudomonas guariconensis]
MHRLIIEVDRQLYLLLERAAQAHQVSLEAECLRRLEVAERHSRYLQALLAELRADEEQRRASNNDRVA